MSADDALFSLIEKNAHARPDELVRVLERMLRRARAEAAGGSNQMEEKRIEDAVEKFSESFTGTTPTDMVKGWRAFKKNNPEAHVEDFLPESLLR
jgi:hypothetical protein